VLYLRGKHHERKLFFAYTLYFAQGEGRRAGGESGGAAAEELARSGAAETGDGGSERAGEPDT